ncbi:MAG: hypothetical protein ACLSVU_01110 [Christensenellales bacterium]
MASSWGTAGTPMLFSGAMAAQSREVKARFWVGLINGMKYLETPGKHSW